jgi:lysophospholipase L1-like esterase
MMKFSAYHFRHKMLRYVLATFVAIGFPFILASAKAGQSIRVACVGDSITYGATLKNRKEDSYPACLGRWLGPDYDVRNFGHSGATLLNKGDLPYEKQKQYPAALAFKPDVVVIMLGTNDSKHRGGGTPTTNNVPENWQYKTDYVPDYEALIAAFRTANPNAKIYVCYPTPCFPGFWGIDDDTIHHQIIPMINQVSIETHASVINFYGPFSGKKDYFPDTVHPNAAGAKLMASVVYHALTGKNPPDKS